MTSYRVFLIGSFLLTLDATAYTQKTITPEAPINLLGDADMADFTMHLWPERSLSDRREEIWSINEDGVMNVSGMGWGYLRTNERYRDYHLVLEYKWGEHTVGYRADRARDCGILVHAHGEDGGFRESWIKSVEAQLIEGGTGDFIVMADEDANKNEQSTRVFAKVRMDRNGQACWSPEGQLARIPPAGKAAARINWRDRDPNWKDVKGFRGEKDIENPVGEWNRMEVICRGDNIRILINGELVNECQGVYPSEGFVAIQSEGAECWVRRWELWPLDRFDDPWQPAAASRNIGALETGEGFLPRRFPWSVEKSLASWRIEGDYDIQLVAAEPVTCDPVDVVWDERGRMFVAEFRDYPIPPVTGGFLSRIRLLEDTDGDGRMDKGTTWADGLNHLQSLFPLQGGLIAITLNEIVFLEDTDDDGKADKTTSLFKTNDPSHSQHLLASPRSGLDNRLYFNNGLTGQVIHPTGQPEQEINFRGWDLRFNPFDRTISLTTGNGQFGASFDNWGRRFFCQNRNPILFAVMPVESLNRNPFAALSMGYESIHPAGAHLYPLIVTHTTVATHLGTFTSASGLIVYRGDAMPEMQGDIFVPDPTAQLVTRNKLIPSGASFTTERVKGEYDFIASSDEWCRPVNVKNGPDGALYICDMYRRFIDHPMFFPKEFVDTNYMRAGLDHGRIWRVVPRNGQMRKVQGLPNSSEKLVEMLAHENAWQRIHSQRLLVERKAYDLAPAIERLFRSTQSPLGRLHALWTLQGLGALNSELVSRTLEDSESRLVESAIRLAGPESHRDLLLKYLLGEDLRLAFLAALKLGDSPRDLTNAYVDLLAGQGGSDPWIRRAILSARQPRSAAVLSRLFDKGKFRGKLSTHDADLLREFSAETAARGNLEGIREIARLVNKGQPMPSNAPIVEGLASGLKRGSSGPRDLEALITDPPAPLSREELAGIESTLDNAVNVALDKSLSVDERIAALKLVEQRGFDEVLAVVGPLCEISEDPAMQLAACRTLSRYDRRKVTEFFFQHWDKLGPSSRAEALELISAREDTGYLLMQKMRLGEINPSLMPTFRRWWLGRRKDPKIASLAKELFGSIDEDRAAVIREYVVALKEATGDPVRGREVFVKAACATCHHLDGVGVDVGPPISDVRFKPPEALLADLLDPNRAVDERYSMYTVETTDGRVYSGIIAAESATTVELKLPGGATERIARNRIARLKTDGLSLMPVGLEHSISKSEMADLVAFLKAQ